MRLFFLLLFVIWCAPVKLGAALHAGDGEKGTLMLGVTVWGVRFLRKKRLSGYGKPRLSDGAEIQEGEMSGQEDDRLGVGMAARLVRTMLISNRARKWFRRSASIEHLRLQVQVGFDDAAACALLDAALKGILGALHYRVPEGIFRSRVAMGHKSYVQGVCIVSIRLGNLLTAALMGALGYIASGKKRKEEKKWSIIPLKI